MGSSPSLLILAAGMGSRYGGLKQAEGFGPSGETLLDYAIHDALKAGFGRIVFLIRREIEPLFRERVLSKYEGKMETTLAFQSLHLPAPFLLPENRSKPWGTAHAVLSAKEALEGDSFATINADDYYGPSSYSTLASFLSNPQSAPSFGMVTFPLEETLSPHGSVTRGLCDVDRHRYLIRVKERSVDRSHLALLPRKTAVNVNLFGFTPHVFPLLQEGWERFLSVHHEDLTSEYLLPVEVGRWVSSGDVKVQTLSSEGPWFGVTHPDDRPQVENRLRELIDKGLYSSPLSLSSPPN
ncbi:NTP transferase domain-containing protein [bacterium]|nr:NTP transferase domain-containing protein [bacterium]